VSTLDRYYHIIQKPLITEKASDDQEHRNAYHFRVPRDANKVEIRHAIEQLFKVKVKSVNTNTSRGKFRRRGWTSGMSPAWKRARVTLAEGNTIEIL
jgi:large subunit ribosomal protein L23